MASVKTNEPTFEAQFTGKDGIVVIIYRYGINDYSAWFTDEENIDNDSYGSSVRGSLLDVFNEVIDVIIEERNDGK